MAAVGAALAGCSGVGSGPSTSQPPPASPVDGVVINVVSGGLTNVTALTLRTAGGRTLVFKLGQLENPAQFPPGHLREHLATAAPVRVYFRVEGSDLVAYRLEDASSLPSFQPGRS